jgi:hypothetical protein
MRLIVRKKDAPKEQAFVESLVFVKPEPKEDSKTHRPDIENFVRNESTNAQHSTALPVEDHNLKLKIEKSKTEVPVIESPSIAAKNDSQTSRNEEQNNETQEMDVEDNDSFDDSNHVINYVRKLMITQFSVLFLSKIY